MNRFYRCLQLFLRFVLNFYYSEVETRGLDQVSQEGPLLLLANHHISLVDPCLLIALSQRPISFLAKEPLFRIPLLGWILNKLHSIPVYRQQDQGYAKEKNENVFDQAKEAVAGGQALAIFPEGLSHDDPSLAPLRHGAAKIALEGETEFSAKVKVVCVGIHFEQTRLFRGRVLVSFSKPLDISKYMRAFFLERFSKEMSAFTGGAPGAPNERLEPRRGEAVDLGYGATGPVMGTIQSITALDSRTTMAQLTEVFRAEISSLILDAETQEDIHLASLVDHLGVIPILEPGLAGDFDRKKQVFDYYQKLKTKKPMQVNRLKRRLRLYARIVETTNFSDQGYVRNLIKNLCLILLGFPFFFLGIFANALPFFLVRFFTIMRTKQEKRGEDARAAIGIVGAVLVFPIWYVGLGIYFLTYFYWGIALLLLTVSPSCGIFALRWLEAWQKILESTIALLISPWTQYTRKRLARFEEGLRLAILRIAA